PAGVGVGVAACDVGRSAMGGPTTRTSVGEGSTAAGVSACGPATGAGRVATAGFGPSGGEVGAAVATVGPVGAEIAAGSANCLASAPVPGNRDASTASMRRTPRPRPFQLADQT